jgi:hypothetical protein
MKKLSAEAVTLYREHGYYAPIRVPSPQEAAAARRELEAHEAVHGKLKGPLRHKSHLLFTWLDKLIRNDAILDAVEDVIGPNILCWGSSFFIKEPRDRGYVSWHQDSTYWGLDPADIVTAWVALSESSAENGAMRVIPDTHLGDQIPHRDTFAEGNLLSRGQEIGRCRRGPGQDARAAAGRVVAPSRPANPRLRPQPVRQAARRLRHPLSPHLCPADRRDA